jgi:hypothetical protein
VNEALRRIFPALRKARFSGRFSACFCLLTALLVLDGLQALMRDDFNRIDLPVGGQAPVIGAMPQQAKDYADLVADIEGNDGLRFTALTDFKGFWLGAPMWRAMLEASADAEPGRAVLTVVDLVPAKSATGNATIMVQNPNLIYAVTVWPSAEAMEAAHFSLSRRLTGLSAFIWAGLSLACATGIGAWHLRLQQRAHRALAQEGIFVVHGMQKTAAGYMAVFSPGAEGGAQVRQAVILFTPEGVEQGTGVLHESSPHKSSALFPLDGTPPGHGWLLRYGEAAKAPEREKDLPA